MATKERRHLYEGMYIVNASLSEDALKKALERITKPIESHGGEVHKIFDEGRKKLAYTINNSKQGNYFLIYFSAPTYAIDKIWKEYKLNEDLMRSIFLRAEKVPEKIEFQPLKPAE